MQWETYQRNFFLSFFILPLLCWQAKAPFSSWPTLSPYLFPGIWPIHLTPCPLCHLEVCPPSWPCMSFTNVWIPHSNKSVGFCCIESLCDLRQNWTSLVIVNVTSKKKLYDNLFWRFWLNCSVLGHDGQVSKDTGLKLGREDKTYFWSRHCVILIW